MEHTQTPWRIGNQFNSLAEQHHEIRQGKKVLFSGNSNFYEQACVDAAFIVRAVNSHDELVEALRQAIGVLDVDGGHDRFVDQLNKALAKAEGR